MNQKIPIYRAKKFDSDEYVEGYLVSNLVSNSNGMPPEVYYNIQNSLFYKYRIDPTTLAIHFPDILDSQRNKIFASLQKDGKGGDILYYKSKIDLVTKTILYFENYRLITHSKGENTFRDKESLSKFEIIGIKE